ncbi:glutathione S-transferase [Sphingomonas sp. NBWT7]|uniref:glutathione S-transferase family protein n=1 Tax=Sphingomonas sp. NBWT7 TaxID=2596913 RepID=UPI001625475D|nr:glutathione S-transferase family protein [Sphingomonas sp. NBWT7]QNE32848.1 glutathione S-transferase [Sphingomonas sp. NBWT7]
MTEYSLHEDPASGNCYKIRLVAAYLGIPLQRRRYDIQRGETRTPAFLTEVNAGGRIPVLQIDARFLPESNAAWAYLAHGSALIPIDRFDHADMLRWLFWERHSHESYIATLRFWRHYLGEAALSPAQTALMPAKQAACEAALALIRGYLTTRDWLAADRPTLADLVLYAYTHLAGESGFDLAARPAVARWLTRVAAMPGHIRFDD